MASRFVASSSIATTGESYWRSKRCANNYYATDRLIRASWPKTGELSKGHCSVTSPQHSLKHHYIKGIGEGPKSDKFERKYLMNATSKESHEYELQQAHGSKGISESIKDAIDLIRTFSRPYAMFAMISGIVSASLLTVERFSDLSPTFFIGLLQYLVAFICMQMYHVGLNQIADVEIDKINKPDLPLASGEFSFKTAVIIVASFLFTSFGIGWVVGSKPMLWALLGGFLLTTAYSINLPFLRWKRFTSLTTLYAIVYPIIVFNLGPFLHMKTHVLKRAAVYPRSLIFTIVMTVFLSAVIALSKDIPDMEGDKALGIQTLAVRLGPKPVFWFCVSLLEIAYGIAIAIGATSPFLWSKVITVSTHTIIALFLWFHAKSVNLESKSSMQSFYMIVFKLVYAEYFLAPFVR